jgi:biotin carboxyl carrier protein
VSGLRQTFKVGGELHDVDVHLAEGHLSGTIGRDDDAREVHVSVTRAGGDAVRVLTDDGARVVTVVRRGGVTYVAIDGEVFEVQDATGSRGDESASHDAPMATSPMTGVVVKVSVAPGDLAAQGQELLVVEAMKMEYIVRAPRDVRIEEVRAEPGASVEMGEPLVLFAEAE